jgi:phosphatidylserine synthase
LRPADAVTLAGALIGSIALAAAIDGNIDLALRLLFTAFAVDAVDGILARKYGATSEGFMLDRAVDRFTQVIIPSTNLLLYVNPSTSYWLYSIYTSILITIGLYRLVYRRVTSLGYFSGLPLIVHPLIIMTSIMAYKKPNLIILFYLLALSVIPIRYFRKPSSGGKQNYYSIARIAGALFLAVIPYGGLIASILYYTVLIGVLAFSIIGPLPLLAEKNEK